MGLGRLGVHPVSMESRSRSRVRNHMHVHHSRRSIRILGQYTDTAQGWYPSHGYLGLVVSVVQLYGYLGKSGIRLQYADTTSIHESVGHLPNLRPPKLRFGQPKPVDQI